MVDNESSQIPPVVPVEYGGKWIVWTLDGTRIAGVGNTPQQAVASAEKSGVMEIIYEYVPPADETYILGVTSRMVEVVPPLLKNRIKPMQATQ